MNKRIAARRTHRSSGLLLAVSAAAICLQISNRASAATQTWTAGDGNWSNPLNWNTGAGPVPGEEDTADIINDDATTPTITYDYTGTVELNSVTIGNDGGGMDTLSMTANYALTSDYEYIGDSGSGSNGVGVFTQTNGTNSIVDSLEIGVNATDTGTFNLGGTGTLSAPGGEIIGYYGTASFNQTAGTNTTASLVIGHFGSGAYNLGGTGTLSAGTIAQYSNGILDQTGGTITTVTLDADNYTLNGGSLSVTGTGYAGTSNDLTGSFTQNGGTASFSGYDAFGNGLEVGYKCQGVFNLNGGTLNVATDEALGNGGNGTFNQASGANIVGPELSIGFLYEGLGDSFGTYNLSGGSVSADVEDVGYNLNTNFFGNLYDPVATGTVDQTGGANTTDALYLGVAPHFMAAAGNYYLKGGSLSTGVEVVGEVAKGATGFLDQTGGTNTTGSLVVSLGTYSLFAGTLSAGNTLNGATIYVSGGTASLGPVTGTGTLNVGGGTPATVTASGLQQSSVTISSNGQLTLTGGGAANVVNSLPISGNGVLDLTNTELIIDYANGPDPIASIEQWIKNGFYNLSGPQIISSAIAAADAATGLSYGIGYADSADPGDPANLPSGEIEIMFTLLGDANLDGTVNAEDFTQFSQNLGQSGMSWDDGDFNYDGTVNAEDFTSFSANLGQTASLAAQAGLLNPANAINLSNVPEPALASLLAIGALVLLRRRVRRSNVASAKLGG